MCLIHAVSHASLAAIIFVLKGKKSRLVELCVRNAKEADPRSKVNLKVLDLSLKYPFRTPLWANLNSDEFERGACSDLKLKCTGSRVQGRVVGRVGLTLAHGSARKQGLPGGHLRQASERRAVAMRIRSRVLCRYVWLSLCCKTRV